MKLFLDAVNTTAIDRAPLGTLRASDVKVAANKLDFRIGNTGVATYDKATFFARIDRDEALVYQFSQDHGGVPERMLQADQFFNVYGMNKPGNADGFGSEILKDFYRDSDGTLYIASFYGVCIVVGGQIIWQDNSVQANHVIAFKNAGRSFLLQSGGRSASIYDCTNRSAPFVLQVKAPKVKAFEKSADGSRIAIIEYDTPNLLRIYAADALAAGAPPLFTGGSYVSLTTDGRNFFALTGNQIDVISPDGSGYVVKPAATLTNFSQPVNVHYGDGHIVVTGSNNGPCLWRAFRVNADMTLTAVRDYTQASEGLTGVVVGSRIILCGKDRGMVDDIPGGAAPVPEPPKPTEKPPTPPTVEVTTTVAIFKPTERAWAEAWRAYLMGPTFNPPITHVGEVITAPDGSLQVEWR